MVLKTGYKICRKIELGSGGYIFDFIDDKIYDSISFIPKNVIIDDSYKVTEVSMNVDTELEILSIISKEELESYNLNILGFIPVQEGFGRGLFIR